MYIYFETLATPEEQLLSRVSCAYRILRQLAKKSKSTTAMPGLMLASPVQLIGS